MITSEIKECMGNCPHCGSENINYLSAEIIDEIVCYPGICEECGGEFNEDYRIEYIETCYNKG